MLQAGHFPGQSPSPLPHRCAFRLQYSITPVNLTCGQITLRNVDYSLIWKHLLNSHVTHYCAAPTVQVRYLPSRTTGDMHNPR